MYLSLLKLDLSLIRARRLLVNPYRLHQAICRAFPDAEEGGYGRVLYRVDEDRQAGTASILVQSEKEPDWGKAALLYTCLGEPPRTKPWDPQVSKGQVLYFRLRANPTVKRNGKRFGLLREEDQLKWLARKALSSGFTVLSCRVVCEGIERSEKTGKQPDASTDGQIMSFLAVRFDGVLRVEKPPLFLKSLQGGIGPGKSMGFGLLSIAPLPRD